MSYMCSVRIAPGSRAGSKNVPKSLKIRLSPDLFFMKLRAPQALRRQTGNYPESGHAACPGLLADYLPISRRSSEFRLCFRCSQGYKHPRRGKEPSERAHRSRRKLHWRSPRASASTLLPHRHKVGGRRGLDWIAIHHHDIDPLRGVGMAESRMRHPIHTRDLLAIELHFFIKRTA
jgi:hypothetical protein